MAIYKIKAGQVITVNADEFVGNAGTIFYDDTGVLRLSDGVTPGGVPISTQGGGGGGGGNGYTGSRGYFGSLGYSGSQGSLGFTGSQGSLGFTGSQGITGYIGSFGYTGSQGSQGFVGSIGFVGSTGNTGYTGSASTVVGYTGSAGAGSGGSSIIKTFNILNEFSAPLIGNSIYVPESSTVIRSLQLTNGVGRVGMDLMVGLYRNNDLLGFYSIPAGQITQKYTGLSHNITTNDYITVNVAAGSGANFSMSMFGV
jgi:hypothetical protein